jgi:adenine-specific DNA-methyltransferase
LQALQALHRRGECCRGCGRPAIQRSLPPSTGAPQACDGTADIACWFIDSDYNDESFFVRNAYFCDGDEPYDKLKRALRAEIDEAEWTRRYATKSVPFDAPNKSKLAVKVINHYGDEVMKVFSLR